jgi:hypothetical protein
METKRISRRSLLQSTATLTTAAVAALTIPTAAIEPVHEDSQAAADHDPVKGEIFDRERHHHWDTV